MLKQVENIVGLTTFFTFPYIFKKKIKKSPFKDKPTCSSSQKLLVHPPSSSSPVATVCLFLLSPAAASLLFLLRSPKRIADEAELVSGFSSVLPAFCVAPPPPAFLVVDGEDDEDAKEMSGFSVAGEEGGWLVEEEKEWAKESG